MTTQKRRYRQAAITYLIYGLLYLSGAVYLAAMDVVARSGWMWFAVGSVFVLVLPPLIWYEFKWVTRILAVLVGVRVAGLGRTIVAGERETVPMPWGGDLPMWIGAVVFLLVAVITAAMLVRAGWQIDRYVGP